MQMSSNPFVYHVPIAPANFVGRERVLSVIFDQLRSPNPANIALHGPLGAGKTSLLNYVSDPKIAEEWGLDPQTCLLCQIDCQSLAGDFTPDRFWQRLLRRMARMLDGDLRESVETLIAQETISFEDIQDVLDDLEWDDRKLVVLLDEFEVVFRTNSEAAEQTTRDFLGKLSSLGRRGVFTMVIATEKPLVELVQELEAWRGSPFPTVFMNVALPTLTEQEADELFDRALAGSDVTFTGDERRRIYERTDGHPARLQAMAAAVFDAKQRGLTGSELWGFVQKRMDDNLRQNGASAGAGFRLDDATGNVWINGDLIENLSTKEYYLLEFLHTNAGRVCSKQEIWEAVWPEYGEEGMADSPIQKLVSRLRGKIEPNPDRPQYIVTVWGRGYRFIEKD